MDRTKYKLFATVVFFSVEVLIGSESALHDFCPQRCNCSVEQPSTDAFVTEVHVNCSGQKIRNVSAIVSGLSNYTTVLDLSRNLIKSVAPNQFSKLPNLAVLLLQNNLVREIEPGTFKGLRRLQRVDLRRNRIRTIKSDAFLETSAGYNCQDVQPAHIPTKDIIYCGIDLRQNDIVNVERNAFAWMKRLSLYLGNSNTALNIDPYAFYGAQEITHLVISDVPSVSLHARLFTNVKGLQLLAISNTHIDQLKAFVFEGLKNADRINFTNVSFSAIEGFAFSGIHFDSDALDNSTTLQIPASRPSNGGGEILFHKCSFRVLATDTFRDTNLARISFSDCNIDSIQSNAFRGMAALQKFHLFQSRIRTLAENGFGSLRNLDELRLEEIELNILVKESFWEVSDVVMFVISVSANTTLDFEAFSGCLNIGTLEISGSKPGISLNIKEGAFSNLVSADQLVIRNFSLPALEKGTFQGMTKIKHLKIESCNVSEISRLAFGDTTGHQGAIESLTMEVGNNLTCNCQTTSTIRQLRHKFFAYNVRCTTEDGQDVEIGNQRLGNDCSESGSTVSTTSIFLLLAILLVSSFHRFRIDLL